MKIQTIIKNISIIALAVAFTSCGRNEIPKAANTTSTVNPNGTFSSDVCFKNKMASDGFGQDIYTIASIIFNNDGSGSNVYELFDDQNCTNSVASGTNTLTYVKSKTFGEISVLQIDQLNDPNDPNSNSRYWMLAIISQDGYLVDIDYSNATSGPFLAEPTEADALTYSNNRYTRSVFFQRQ